MGEKLPRILPKVATSTSLLGFFTYRKFTAWDRRLYFPSEGMRAEDLNPRTRVPEASTLTSRPPKPRNTTSIHRILIDRSLIARPPVLSSSNILPPPTSHCAFIRASKISGSVLKILFLLFNFLQTASV